MNNFMTKKINNLDKIDKFHEKYKFTKFDTRSPTAQFALQK